MMIGIGILTAMVGVNLMMHLDRFLHHKLDELQYRQLIARTVREIRQQDWANQRTQKYARVIKWMNTPPKYVVQNIKGLYYLTTMRYDDLYYLNFDKWAFAEKRKKGTGFTNEDALYEAVLRYLVKKNDA